MATSAATGSSVADQGGATEEDGRESTTTSALSRMIMVRLSKAQCHKFYTTLAAFGVVQGKWDRLLGMLQQSGVFPDVTRQLLIDHGKLLLQSLVDKELRKKLPLWVVAEDVAPRIDMKRRLAVLDTMWSVFVELNAASQRELCAKHGWRDLSRFWTRCVNVSLPGFAAMLPVFSTGVHGCVPFLDSAPSCACAVAR